MALNRHQEGHLCTVGELEQEGTVSLGLTSARNMLPGDSNFASLHARMSMNDHKRLWVLSFELQINFSKWVNSYRWTLQIMQINCRTRSRRALTFHQDTQREARFDITSRMKLQHCAAAPPYPQFQLFTVNLVRKGYFSPNIGMACSFHPAIDISMAR